MNEGRIEQTGSPQELFNEPQSEFVARFIGGHNIINWTTGVAVFAATALLTLLVAMPQYAMWNTWDTMYDCQ